MKDAIHDAVTPTVMRTFPTASNRGDLTMRELVDAYMAAYAGRDGALAQRLNYWVQTIGAIRMRELDADLVADHLERGRRELIIELIMEGFSPEEAFAQALIDGALYLPNDRG